MNQALSSFPYFVSLYHKFPKKLTEQMIQVFAAKDMLNETLLDLKRYAQNDINLEISAITDSNLNLKEFIFTYEIMRPRINKVVMARIMSFIEIIDEQIKFLNDQLGAEQDNIRISTYCVGNGLTLVVCEDVANKHSRYLKDAI